MKRHFKKLILFYILASISALFLSCEDFTVLSKWKTGEVTIDGIDAGKEWDGAKYFFEKSNCSVGLINDNDFMYLRLSTSDRSIQKSILAQGLSIYFNDKGSKDKKIGICFPAGLKRNGKKNPSETKPQGQSSPPDDNTPGQNGPPDDNTPGQFTPPDNDNNPNNIKDTAKRHDEEIATAIKNSSANIVITGPAKNVSTTLSIEDANSYKIFAAVNYEKGNLVLEMKVPVIRDENNPYGIGIKKTKEIGVGFLVNIVSQNRPEGSGGMSGGRGGGNSGGGMGGMGGGMGGGGMGGGGMGGGGMGGMGGMGGGGMGGGMGGGGMGQSGRMSSSANTTVEFWLDVQLAAE